MQELNYTKRVTGGKIIIEVPEEFDGKELQISIKEAEKGEDNVEKWHELPAEKRLEILERYKGSAKFPDVEINKYDVYDQ